MSSDDNQVQNIYKYCRKTYKKSKRGIQQTDAGISHEEAKNEDINMPPTSEVKTDGISMGVAGCSCTLDSEGEIANILHKKCPVITLAQQQLQRVLDETDKLFCDNTRCCRSVYDFLHVCKEILVMHNKCNCVIMVLTTVTFALGILLGAASCGTYLGRFNSPILTCIDNFFIPETYTKIENSYRSIV